MTEVSQEVNIALNKAKIALMNKSSSAFFTTVLFSLKFKWDDGIPKAATDGYSIFVNPTFFMSLKPGERVFVLVHESQHVAYMHNGRLQGRDKNVFNQAADHVINLQLLDAGFEMPNWVLKDPAFKGMSTEQVYDELMKNPQKQQKNGMPDLVEADGNGQGDGEGAAQAKLEAHVKEVLVRAAMQSKMAGDKAGSIPGDIELFLDKLLNPKLPWTAILRKYVNSFAKTDFTWKKPNRRYFPDHHLPSMYGEALNSLTAYVDISGSVSDEDFKRFVSELSGIFRMVKLQKLTVVQFDTTIKSSDTVHSLAELSKIKFTGRGGTWIKPVLDLIDKNPKELSLIFTDGEFHQAGFHSKGNIVWLIHDNPNWKSDYGRVIHYSMKD